MTLGRSFWDTSPTVPTPSTPKSPLLMSTRDRLLCFHPLRVRGLKFRRRGMGWDDDPSTSLSPQSRPRPLLNPKSTTFVEDDYSSSSVVNLGDIWRGREISLKI